MLRYKVIDRADRTLPAGSVTLPCVQSPPACATPVPVHYGLISIFAGLRTGQFSNLER